MIISLILIFTLTFLCQKKNWKECGKIWGIAFLLCTCIHYIFFAVLEREMSKALLADSIQWSFCTLLNFLFLRFLIEILREYAEKSLCFVMLGIVILCYLLFFRRIWEFEEYLLLLLKIRLAIFELIGEVFTARRSLGDWKEYLLYSYFPYQESVSFILIFTLPFLCRKKNWKECGKVLGITFFLCACFHYAFIAIVHHFPPMTATWHILNKNLLKDAFRWSFYTLTHCILLRLLLEVLRKKNAGTIVYPMVFVPVFLFYLLFYRTILVYEYMLFALLFGL